MAFYSPADTSRQKSHQHPTKARKTACSRRAHAILEGNGAGSFPCLCAAIGTGNAGESSIDLSELEVSTGNTSSVKENSTDFVIAEINDPENPVGVWCPSCDRQLALQTSLKYLSRVSFDGVLKAVILLVLEDQSEATGAYAAICQQLSAFTEGCKKILEKVDSTDAATLPKQKWPKLCIRVIFCCYELGSLRAKGSDSKNQNLLAQNAREGLNSTILAFDDMKHFGSTGSVGSCAVVSQKAIDKEFYVAYKITVPLSSTAKAAQIMSEIWANGGAFVSARPPTTGLQRALTSPNVSAWVTNLNYCELKKIDSKESTLVAALHWILEHVMGGTRFGVVQTIVEYWACETTCS